MPGPPDPAEIPAAIPAATVILIRDTPGDAAPDLLLTERARRMAFAAGAIVFPGGRVDPADHRAAADHPTLEDAAARIAAIRETIEEVGIAIGLTPIPYAATVAALRTALAAGQDFTTLLADAGLRLDLDQLVPFARWCPHGHETRIFDTRFYLARAPVDATPIPDGTETAAAYWAPAASILADADVGRRHIIFPTRRNLERLALFADFYAAAAHARGIAPDRIVPWIEARGDGDWICIPTDRGYPVTAERVATARRG